MKTKVLVVLVGLFFLSAPSVMAQDFCKGDFDYDGDVMQGDISDFKANMGRWAGYNPCPLDGPAPVPVTGQTTSYATGDDGDYEFGVAWPNPRFTDNGNGTVTDNLTGLIWLKDANCFGPRTWAQALSDCNGLASDSCGLTNGSNAGDWRLPNRNELNSLVDVRYDTPALCNTAGTGKWTNNDPFINVNYVYYYWSSTTNALSTFAAWNVYMYNGDVYSGHLKSFGYYVWPVGGGH